MGRPKISLAVVVLWILFSIYYQENLGMLQAGLGASCSHVFWTVNSHTVDSFSCCLSHMETGPLFCAANGDGGSFLLTPHNRQDQFRQAEAGLHQTAWFWFGGRPLQHQMGCMGTGRQPALYGIWHIFTNHSDLFLPRIVVYLWVMATEKFVGGAIF